MQRKNHILKSSSQNKRAGFAMIMAIIVIVVISTIMALSLALTAQTGKRTTDLYLYEQSVLYSKSAAELALLDIAQKGPCTPIASYTIDNIYDVNVSVRYIYTDTSICASSNRYFNINTNEQNGSVLMDITVSINPGANVTSEPIRYFRRSIQKL